MVDRQINGRLDKLAGKQEDRQAGRAGVRNVGIEGCIYGQAGRRQARKQSSREAYTLARWEASRQIVAIIFS